MDRPFLVHRQQTLRATILISVVISIIYALNQYITVDNYNLN
jgi:hypothetical protein